MVQPYSLELLQQHFPSRRDLSTGAEFELAIVCCGGTSTGPYVAGVLDYLWEAFEAWRKAVAEGEAPKHRVKIRYLVGASAGGLSLGLAAAAAVKAFPHVYHDDLWKQYNPGGAPPPQPVNENPHYRAWVSEITLDRLLSHPEEIRSGQIYLFHSAPAEICDTVLDLIAAAPDATAPRDWVCDPLELRTTIGNLQGVPHALDFNHLKGALQVTEEYFTAHRDNIAFAIETGHLGGASTGLGPPPDCHELPKGAFNPPTANPPPALSRARDMFRSAMVATSAIPMVFKITEVPQTPIVYQWRDAYWDRDLNKAVVDMPIWKQPKDPLDYAATDGGLFDNRPFNLAHQRLAGARGSNPQDPDKARRAVVLIDPLADDAAPIPQNPDKDNIFAVLAGLVMTPVLQDRLDTVDLAQIRDETISSRFMIAPSRSSPIQPDQSWSPSRSLLSAPMHAFLGFAAEAYRKHDFLLGRRNAQQFLRKVLVLPATNPVVAGADGWQAHDQFEEDGVVYRTLVPRRGRALDEQPAPEWDWDALTDKDIDRYGALVKARADAIFKNLETSKAIGGGLGGFLAKFYLKIGWTFAGRGKVVDWFKTSMRQARQGLDPRNRNPAGAPPKPAGG